jgi:hypothetical protein
MQPNLRKYTWFALNERDTVLSMAIRAVLLAVVSFTVLLPGAARADIIGFNGVWAPVDAGGNFINGFVSAGVQSGQSLAMNLSGNHSTLTIDFNNPAGIGPSSIFTQNNGATLPTGTVAYDWSITFDQSASWLFETDVTTALPANDHPAFTTAGKYTGHSTYNYPAGTYFSYGNVEFGDSNALHARAVLTNFVYTGGATVTPEPASGFLIGGALIGLTAIRRRFRS